LQQRQIIFAFGGKGLNVINTFDYTFDYTFHLHRVAPDCKIKFNVNNCSEGIFIRWIDRHGFYQYYLISQKTKTFNSENDGDPVAMDYESYGRWYHNVNRQNKKETKIVNGYVSLVNKGDYETIISLFASPLVWVYMGIYNNGEEWLPVTIQPVGNVMTFASLQDINVNIIFPAAQIQQL
jgi:hypothetical protein